MDGDMGSMFFFVQPCILFPRGFRLNIPRDRPSLPRVGNNIIIDVFYRPCFQFHDCGRAGLAFGRPEATPPPLPLLFPCD